MERVQHYSYLGIWADKELTFMDYPIHIDTMFKFKAEIDIAFFLEINLAVIYLQEDKVVKQFCSVLDSRDVIYGRLASSTLTLLDAVHHTTLRSINGDMSWDTTV